MGVRVSGAILAGGKSRRMGRDKALIELDGKPLYLGIAQRMAEIADPVFIAPGTSGRLGALPFPEIPDALPDAGPLAPIASALDGSPHQLLAVVAADMPYASPAIFSLLLDVLKDEQAVIPITDRGSQSLHALYSRAALPVIEAALSEKRFRVRDVLAQLEVREVGESEWRTVAPSGRFALNLNTPTDLADLT